MKIAWIFIMPVILFSPVSNSNHVSPILPQTPPARNLFIITLDGFRWQEVYRGANTFLLENEKYTPDNKTIKFLYDGSTNEERRLKLMPFFWNVIAKQGQLFGNRDLNNKINTANDYAISYPGYNELFAGNIDPDISSNRKLFNPHITVLEYLNRLPDYQNKVMVFSSWDVFPWIFNTDRSGLPVYCASSLAELPMTETQAMINRIEDDILEEKNGTRNDLLTFLTAKELIAANQPRVVYLALGETDEFAHEERYDLYLEQANKCDRMIGELWHWVQTTPGYKDNTTFMITTDHGRGSRNRNWMSHGEFIPGSSQTWLAVIGPGIAPLGEIKEGEQLYQQQLASTIAQLLGERFQP